MKEPAHGSDKIVVQFSMKQWSQLIAKLQAQDNSACLDVLRDNFSEPKILSIVSLGLQLFGRPHEPAQGPVWVWA